MKKLLIITLLALSSSTFASCELFTSDSMARVFLQQSGFTVVNSAAQADFSVNLNTFSGSRTTGICSGLTRNCRQHNSTFGTLAITKQDRRRGTIQVYAAMDDETVIYNRKGKYPLPAAELVKRKLLNSRFLQAVRNNCQ